ncbi:hypothetical protein TNCT_444261 [Trichonephila clavata]|uniref:Uncharacterized protein n=1 Tax=Trichonephila clavata TaxID=2740835 RepID=A0A8X6FY82_TRICU|nr:hypothetical protein TNCT_444261 [Trichonephila clavata]
MAVVRLAETGFVFHASGNPSASPAGEQPKEKGHQLQSNYMRAKRSGKHKPSESRAKLKSTWPYYEMSFLDPGVLLAMLHLSNNKSCFMQIMLETCMR